MSGCSAGLGAGNQSTYLARVRWLPLVLLFGVTHPLWEGSARAEPAGVDSLPPQAIARLGRLQPLRHTAWINGLTFSPDGRALVTIGRDGWVRAWELATGRERFSFPSKEIGDSVLAFSARGQQLLYGSGTGIELHDPTSGSFLRALKLDLGRPLRELSLIGDRVAWASHDWKIGTVDPSADKATVLVSGQLHVQECFAASPRGDQIAYCQDGALHLIDVQDGRPRQSFPLKGHTAVFAPRGDQLALGVGERVILLDPKTRQERGLLTASRATSLSYSPDGRLLGVGGTDGRLRLYDAASGQLVRELPLSDAGPRGSIVHLRFSPSGEGLAAVSGGGQSVVLLDPSSGRRRYDDGGHLDAISDVAFSGNGQRLVSADWEGRVILWGLDGAPRRIDMQSATRVSLAATARTAAPDSLLAIPEESRGLAAIERCPFGPQQVRQLGSGALALLDADGRTLARWDVGRSQRPWLLWSPGCRFLVSLDSRLGRVEIVRTRDGRRRSRELGKYVRLLPAIAPNDQILALSVAAQEPRIDPHKGPLYEARVHVIDLASGHELSAFALDGFLYRLLYAPDGRSLAAAIGRRIELRTASGALLRTLTGHADDVTALAFSPDGNRLASGSRDSTVFLWRIDPSAP